MRSLFILPLLLLPLANSQNKNPVVSQGSPELAVVSHKCYKSRQVPDRFNDPDPRPRNWNFAEIRLTYARAMATPWTEMCRGL